MLEKKKASWEDKQHLLSEKYIYLTFREFFLEFSIFDIISDIFFRNKLSSVKQFTVDNKIKNNIYSII